MVAELIDKYIWLVQTFINAGDNGLSLKDLERKWERRYNEEYPRRTFNNHRDAVEEIFGIEIECDRSTNRYYISYGSDITDQDSSRQWLINTFTVNNLLSMGKERLSGRVSVEDIPSGQIYLTSIMTAMDEGRVLQISYKKYSEAEGETLHVAPYGVREFQKRWYLVGYCKERRALRVYALDRICAMEATEEFFSLPKDFDIDSLFAQSYGIYLPEEGKKAALVTFCATEREARYLRDLPLHPSQVEISSEDGKVTFGIRVIPDDSLIMDLCRLGSRIEVISPATVRDQVAGELKSALSKYR